MNLEKSGRMLVVVAAVAMLAMVLQGCGGDDGVSQGRFDDEVAKAAAAETARTKAEADKAAAEKARMEAEANRAAAQKARMDADEAKKRAEEAQKMAEAAKMKAETAESTEAARLRAEAEKARADAKKFADEAATKAAEATRKENHAEAERIFVALDASNDRMETRTTVFNTPGWQLAQSHSLQGTNNRVRRLKLTASTLKATFPGYEEDTSLARIGERWSGVRLKGIVNENDKIVIYSDKPAQKKPLRELYTRITDSAGDYYQITSAGAGKTLKLADAKGDLNQAVTRTGGTGATGTSTLKGKVLGTVPGTFRCMAAQSSCGTGGTQAAGFTLTGTNWRFTPTDANATAFAPYLYFGWWIDEKDDGTLDYDYFRGAFGSTMRTPEFTMSATSARGEDIDGTAVYKGAAAGQYAIRDLGGQKENTQAGAFTADVMLSVNFDADKLEYDTGTANKSTTQSIDTDGIIISGKIDNFQATYAGSEKWVINLSVNGDANERSHVPLTTIYRGAPGGPNFHRTQHFSSWKLNADDPNVTPITTGRWFGLYYGGAHNEAPDGVVGNFRAGQSHGGLHRIAGSFAATKTSE